MAAADPPPTDERPGLVAMGAHGDLTGRLLLPGLSGLVRSRDIQIERPVQRCCRLGPRLCGRSPKQLCLTLLAPRHRTLSRVLAADGLSRDVSRPQCLPSTVTREFVDGSSWLSDPVVSMTEPGLRSTDEPDGVRHRGHRREAEVEAAIGGRTGGTECPRRCRIESFNRPVRGQGQAPVTLLIALHPGVGLVAAAATAAERTGLLPVALVRLPRHWTLRRDPPCCRGKF